MARDALQRISSWRIPESGKGIAEEDSRDANPIQQTS